MQHREKNEGANRENRVFYLDPKIYGVNIACIEGTKPFDIKNIPVNDGENHPHDKK